MKYYFRCFYNILPNFATKQQVMKKLYFLFFIVFVCSFNLNAQVGIGTTSPDVSAALELSSSSKGLLIPRMTQVNRIAISSPATGLLVYQSDLTTGYYYFDGTIWKSFDGSGWAVTGDSATNVAVNKIGTLDAQDLVIITNDTEAMRIDTNGNVGIGISNPTEKLHIVGTAPVFRYEDGNEGAGKVLITDASGIVSWGTTPTVGLDNDWIFFSGNTLSDEIYHTGGVVFGRTGTTTNQLDVDNGSTTGTTLGLGNEEYIEDGNNEIMFSHDIKPDESNYTFDYANYLGDAVDRYNTLYTINTPITTSDRREKKNITDLNYGLKEVLQLRPVTYKWKEEKVGTGKLKVTDKREILGLIAQEVQQIIPEVVHDTEWRALKNKNDVYEKVKRDRLGMTFAELLPVLIKAKQEQHEELLELQKENLILLRKVLALKEKKN